MFLLRSDYHRGTGLVVPIGVCQADKEEGSAREGFNEQRRIGINVHGLFIDSI